jgi:signal transduction histidine kinase
MISWSTAATPSADCAARHIVRIGTDVTERRIAETALQVSETALRQSERQLQVLADGLINGQEEERHRLAQGLKDRIGQKLRAAGTELNGLAHKGASIPAAKLASLSVRVNEAADELRSVAQQLQSPDLEETGLAAAIKSYCSDFQKKEGIQVRLTTKHVPAKIPGNVSLGLYRVVQDALDNVAKHSGAREASVLVKGSDRAITLVVKDSGRGFQTDRQRGRGVGLISMRERARRLGGEFSLQTKPGEGVEVEVRVPLARKPSSH